MEGIYQDDKTKVVQWMPSEKNAVEYVNKFYSHITPTIIHE